MRCSINLGDILARNPTRRTPWNVTDQMRDWKDSIRDIGGFYQASGQYWTGDERDIVTRLEAERFFANRLGAHIVRADQGGSEIGWEGYISEMILTADGITRRRAISDIATKLRIGYTRYTGNLLTNGSGELGTHVIGEIWGGTPPTDTGIRVFRTAPVGDWPNVCFDNSWHTHGVRSIKVDTHNLEGLDGGGIEFASTTNVVPDGRYCVRVDLYTNGLGPGDYLTVTVTDGSNQLYGRDALTANGTLSFARIFDAPPTASGALHVNVYAHGNDTTFWVDNAQIYQSGTPAVTPWAENTVATAMWGLHEATVTCKPMTDAEAVRRRDQLLADWAYPRTRVRGMTSEDTLGLSVKCEGYIFKASNQSVKLGGVKAASTHITDLLTGNAYISAGYVHTNPTECYVDETQATGLWLGLQDVTEVGQVGDIAYIGGMHANGKFDYELRPTVATIKFKGGRWLDMNNNPLNSQTVRPCIALFEDAVSAEGGNYTNILNDPKYAYISGWEYDAESDTASPLELVELH